MHPQVILNKEKMASLQADLSKQILEDIPNPEKLLMVGIQRRGADLAKRLAAYIFDATGINIQTGFLDINLYRDDWSILSDGSPHIGNSDLPIAIDGREILLVDDVLFSGRTVRAALEALFDYGRPANVKLLVFIDRGHRELPICPDYTGMKIETTVQQHVDVFFEERDGKEEVCLS